jgi:hypothetical protein
MSLDPNQREKILSKLVELAKQPAWKAWAWHQAKEYERINPYDLKGLQEELKERMLKEKEAAA